MSPPSQFNADERIRNLERTLNGDGINPGLSGQFQSFIAVWKSREEDKKIYDDRQARRINVLLTVAGVLIALAACIISLLLYEHEVHHSLLQPPAIMRSEPQRVAAYAHPR